MHVIIQAGGKGTRLESLTRNRPKCLVPVDNRPMIFWTFEAFKGADFSVICDYKADVLERYLAAFGAQYSVKIVSADGTGTISGIEQVVSQIRDDEPILIVWCDLFFEKDYRVPEALTERPLKANFVGLSGTFPCRWSFENGQFIHAASSSAGVAGFFVFKNKDELRDIPREGALVPWLQGKGTTFAPLYLEHVTEVGTLSAFEAIKKPSICRPFNEVVLNDETITKRGIDEQGKKIAADEINWYKHVTALGCTSIPKLYSYEPLVMERIRGRNIFEYDCLTVTEKKKIVKSIVKALDDLHHLEPEIDAVTADLDSNYITKTFDRLQKVENLVPFAKDEYIRINGRYYKNIFYDRCGAVRFLGLRPVLDALPVGCALRLGRGQRGCRPEQLCCPALRKPPHELAALYVGRGHYHRPCGDGCGAFRRAELEQRLPVHCPVPDRTFCRAFLQPAPVA